MKKVIKIKTIPEGSKVLDGFGRVDYQDIYQVKKNTEKSAEEISKELMVMPGWVNLLFKIRNRIVGVFGLKTDKNTVRSDTFFTVIEKNESEIIMGEPDKHLDFRASIIKNETEGTVSLITVVHYNNVWGRVYFFPVKPFHKIIMRVLLKRYLKTNQ